MEVKKTKTVRFDALVKEAGRPEQVTLWTKPEDNREFMDAVKGGRVVSVIQHNVGTKKDRGVVGFVTVKNAAYLVFPKRIGAATDSKVVGIKYDRVLPESAKGPIFKSKKQGAPGIPMRERRNYVEAKEADEEEGRKITKSAKVVERYAARVEMKSEEH